MSAPRTFSVSDFFVLRTPSLPFELQSGWSQDLQTLHSGPEQLAAAAEQDRAALREQLRATVRRPEVREALFLASPDLEATLDPWLSGELSPERAQRIDLSLVRYLTRMSSRPTPFGLFAGCAVGAWSDTSRLQVPAWRHCQRRTRLDQDYLGALQEVLEVSPEVQASQRYRPNSSLYQVAGQFRYAEARQTPGAGREFHLVALEATEHLQWTLDRARHGMTLATLASDLAQISQTPVAEAEHFLQQLVADQILVSELAPPLTGPEPLATLAHRLAADPGTRALGASLAAVQAGLNHLDSQGIGHDPAAYRRLSDGLRELPAKLDPKHLFQVDQHSSGTGLTLDQTVRRTVEEAIDLLRILTPARPHPDLERFKATFRERYENRWVPLLEALDHEAGIGFGSALSPGRQGVPLLEGLPLEEAGQDRERPFTARDQYLLQRLQSLDGAQEWDLDDDAVAALRTPHPAPLPDAFAALAILAGSGPEALLQGHFQLLLETYTGPSGARLLGRFCQADPVLEARVRAHVAAEEACRPDLLFAEWVHQPDGRTGNILARPTLRRHEIPFLGVSGVPDPDQIQAAELEVTVRGDRVRLRSPRLGRELVVRLSSAHNFSQGLPVYRFLALLQDQDGPGGGWSWGCLAQLPFLPRVSRGRHVLARARWRIEARELGEAPGFASIQRLRRQRRLPRLVVLEDGDNALLVDLDQALRVDTLLHLVRNRPAFTLREAFPGPDHLVASGPDGSFCHELVLPFQTTRPDLVVPVKPVPAQTGALARVFPPGSEWLYLKVYTGEASADRVLLETLAPFLESCRGLWHRWFFLRYHDPAPHLRLRFQGDPDLLSNVLLPRLQKALAPLIPGLCWKLQLDTYERELERYGGADGMPLAETWFWLDSERALDLLPICLGDAGAEQRWRLALKGVDTLLGDLGFDLAGKARIVTRTRAGLAQEFETQDGLTPKLGERFRRLRPELDPLLNPGSGDAELEGWLRFSAMQRSCLDGLRRAAQEGRLSSPLEELASSFAHMHICRLLRSQQRAQEFVIMDFLGRLYEARLARERGQAKPRAGFGS